MSVSDEPILRSYVPPTHPSLEPQPPPPQPPPQQQQQQATTQSSTKTQP